MAEISVIVPIYKVEPYLKRCVESILNQSFRDFDLILIDDGSPDKCGLICDDYAVKDSRVRVIHQSNAGLSAARNAGIDWAFSYSDSKWLTFIDSDDWIHPDMLKWLYQSVNDFKVPISVCSYCETTNTDVKFDKTPAKLKIWKTEDFYLHKNVNATVAWGKLYQKNCFRQIRYPIGKYHEDEFITYKILFEIPQVVVVEAPLYVYFQNKEGIMHSRWSPRKLDVLEAFEMQIEFFREKGLQDIYKHRVWLYVDSAMWQYTQSREFLLNNKLMERLKWKVAVKYFRNCRQNIWNKNEQIHILEFLFPRSMNFFWLACAAKKKLKKEGVCAVIKKIINYFKNMKK